MKYFIFLGLFTLSLFGAELNWSHDYEQVRQKAQKSKKPIYLLITSDDCKWCRNFLPLTVQYIEKTYAAGKIPGVVHISRDRYSVPQGFETSPVPRHYFIDSKGEILYSSLGHRQQECFESFMDNAQKKTKTSK